jgi:hypothetical protein
MKVVVVFLKNALSLRSALKRSLISLIIIGLLLAGCNEVQSSEPAYIYVPQYIDKVAYIDRIEYVEKVVTKYVTEGREFRSIDEVEEWYLEHKGLLESGYCTDYAKQLQGLAYEDGYYMSVCLVKDGVVYQTRIRGVGEDHAGNLVTIGRKWYYIEPIPKWHDIIQVCETY